jgi:hypothetical protein
MKYGGGLLRGALASHNLHSGFVFDASNQPLGKCAEHLARLFVAFFEEQHGGVIAHSHLEE